MSEDLGHNFLWNGFTHVCGKCGKTEQDASGYGGQIMPCRTSREERIYARLDEDAFELFRSAPIGTKAPSILGGNWTKTDQGWKALGGDTFPRPGGDWDRSLIIPKS